VVSVDRARDQFDVMVEFWLQQNPSLDVTVKTLSMRLRRAAHLLDRATRRELASCDMEMWEFDVLLSLYKTPGHQTSVGALLRESGVTSGAITNRVERLERRALVTREVDPADRRQVLVTLTEAGRARAEQMVMMKTEAEQRFFGSIERSTLERLTDDLRSVILSLEAAGLADCPGVSPLSSDGAVEKNSSQ
jgi:DNA-binding MarR family transcriptional regulator